MGPSPPLPAGGRPGRRAAAGGRRAACSGSRLTWIPGASADLDVGADGRGHGCDVGPLGDSYLDLGASELDLGASTLKFGVSIPDLGASDLHLGASGP